MLIQQEYRMMIEYLYLNNDGGDVDDPENSSECFS